MIWLGSLRLEDMSVETNWARTGNASAAAANPVPMTLVTID